MRTNWSCNSVAWVYRKKHLLSPVQHGIVLRPEPKYLRWWQCWAQLHGYLILNSLQSSTMSHLAFSQAVSVCISLLKALWAGCTIPSQWNTWIIILFLCVPWQFILFDSYHYLLGSPIGIPLSTGLITITQRQNSPIEVCRVWPCSMSMPKIFIIINILFTFSLWVLWG